MMVRVALNRVGEVQAVRKVAVHLLFNIYILFNIYLLNISYQVSFVIEVLNFDSL